MDLTKIQLFGLTCWVHQKKQIRDQGYGVKSDKKQQARLSILVGYNDQMGPLMKSEHVPVIECEPKKREYITPLVGTRHVDPTSGLLYEVV